MSRTDQHRFTSPGPWTARVLDSRLLTEVPIRRVLAMAGAGLVAAGATASWLAWDDGQPTGQPRAGVKAVTLTVRTPMADAAPQPTVAVTSSPAAPTPTKPLPSAPRDGPGRDGDAQPAEAVVTDPPARIDERADKETKPPKKVKHRKTRGGRPPQ